MAVKERMTNVEKVEKPFKKHSQNGRADHSIKFKITVIYIYI